MKTIALILVLLSSQSYGAMAFWTGRQQMTQTVTYQYVYKCEYNYASQTFWQLFKGYCPSSIELQ